MRGSDINIDITRKCTLKCRHCYNHSGEMNNDELASDELFRIMNDLASTRPDNFCICGGEPLLKKEIIENIEEIKINSPEDGVCHILNVTFYGIKGEVLLHYLEQKGVYVSTGSACSSKKKGSHVLNAIGLSPQEIEGAIRFSLSDLNTEEEIKEAVKIVKESVSDLRMIMRRR